MTCISTRIAAKKLLAVVMLLGMLASAGMCRHAEAIPPRRLVEVADFSSPVVSPDGQRVAFRLEQASVERNTYDSVWYVQRLDGTSPPRRVADGGTPLRDSAGLARPAPVVWSPDGRWIYYRALLDGKIDVWRAAADGSGAEPMSLDPADVRDFVLRADGRVLNYSVGATREEVIAAELAEYDRGFHIDESAPIGQSLFRSGFIEGRLATQRLGAWFDRVPLLADVPDRWKAVDLATRSSRDLAPSEVPPVPLAASDLAAELADGLWKLAHDPASGRIALLRRVGERGTLRDRPDVELAMVRGRRDRTPVKCLAELCTKKAITDIQWRPGSHEVLFTVTDRDEGYGQSILGWNVETGTVRPIADSRGLISGEFRWTPGVCGVAPTALACVAADADRPPRLERIDLESGDRRVLFDPNAALAWDMRGVPVRLLRWNDAEGRQFTGQFYPAHGTGDSLPPLFVSYYRCMGYVRGGAGDEWPFAALAAHGISALCVNALPHNHDASARYDAGRSAVASAVELLAAEGEVDRTRVGMGGLSFGAEATLWTVMHSDLISAASVASPVTSHLYYLLGSMRSMGGDPWFFEGLKRNWQLGPPGETGEQWRKLSPALNLDRIHVPILMQLSEQEYIHSLDYAIPLVKSLKADAYIFAHEPHQKFQPRHKAAVYQRNLDWFRFWLQGVEDADPAKADQYSHWRSMRAAASTASADRDGHAGDKD